MKCYVFVPDRLPFDGADLCIILGNLLDNAMEAVGCFPTGHTLHIFAFPFFVKIVVIGYIVFG